MGTGRAKTVSCRATRGTVARELPEDPQLTTDRPIAKKVVRALKRASRDKVIDLEAFAAGRDHTEELQQTVATREALARLHPAHAIYTYAQNQLSVMAEQLTSLDEMSRFARIISEADDEYLPNGPPVSPLTRSFFTCWASFDVSLGLAKETLATTAIAVGTALGMHGELLRLFRLLQQSRMGIYAHEGMEGEAVVLRELVTDAVCRTINPSGYRGTQGELWYVRVLPPPSPGNEHLVFTTPYILLAPDEREWQAYFLRALPDAGPSRRIASYEQHMKYGPARNYWTEFVFEAYVNHCPEAIFLSGLPDVAESRPHSRVHGR